MADGRRVRHYLARVKAATTGVNHNVSDLSHSHALFLTLLFDLDTVSFISIPLFLPLSLNYVYILHSFNRHLGLDLVPRKDFEMVDADQISVSDLYKMASIHLIAFILSWL